MMVVKSRQVRTTVLTIGLVLSGLVQRAIAADPAQVERLLKSNQCPVCDLSGADLANANLFGANLVGANLKGANLSGANLGSTNLTDADLTGATLKNTYLYLATLENTNFSQADLSGAYLRDAILLDTRFTGANLQGINLSRTNLTGIALSGVDLTNANLSGAVLSGVRSPSMTREYQMLWSTFGLTSLQSGSQCFGPDSPELKSSSQYGFSLAFADLSQSKLRGANLSNAVLFNGNLTGADLSAADLTNAVLVCANLKNATLDGADLKDARLERVVLDGASLNNLKNANLQKTFKTEEEKAATPIEAEAKAYLGAMGRAQQAYYLEKSTFAGNLNDLGLGIKPDGKHYLYRIFLYRDRSKAVMLAAVPRSTGFKSYVGYVNVSKRPKMSDSITYATLCESEAASPQLPKMPATFPQKGPTTCPAGFQPLKR